MNIKKDELLTRTRKFQEKNAYLPQLVILSVTFFQEACQREEIIEETLEHYKASTRYCFCIVHSTQLGLRAIP